MTSLITVLTTLKKYGVFGPKLITISNAYFINNQWVLPWPKNEILSKEVWSNHIRYNFFFTIFLGKFVKVKTRMVLSNLMPNNKALELNLFTDLFSLSFYCLAFNFFFFFVGERRGLYYLFHAQKIAQTTNQQNLLLVRLVYRKRW